MTVHVGLPLCIYRDAAHECHDLRFLVELDLLLPDPAFNVRPTEETLIDGAERREMAISDVILLGELGKARKDVVALGHIDAVGSGALPKVRHFQSWSESLSRAR